MGTKHHTPKAVKAVALHNPQQVEAAMAEVLALKRLPPHPNLITGEVLRRLAPPKALCIVMPQCLGPVECYLSNFKFARAAQNRQQSQLPSSTRAAFSRDLLSAVRHLHCNGVVHGDLAPGNLLVHLRDHRANLRVGDLSMSRVVQNWSGEPTPRSSIRGLPGGWCTFNYSAPENLEISQGGKVGFPIDDWSVGALISEWCLGWWWTRPDGSEAWARREWIQFKGKLLQGVLQELQSASELEPTTVGALCSLLEADPLRRACVCDVVEALGPPVDSPPLTATPHLLSSPGLANPTPTAFPQPVVSGPRAGQETTSPLPPKELSSASLAPLDEKLVAHGTLSWTRLSDAATSEDQCTCSGHCAASCPARQHRKCGESRVRLRCPNATAAGRKFCHSCLCRVEGCAQRRFEGAAHCHRHGSQSVQSPNPGLPVTGRAEQEPPPAVRASPALVAAADGPALPRTTGPSVPAMAALFVRERARAPSG